MDYLYNGDGRVIGIVVGYGEDGRPIHLEYEDAEFEAYLDDMDAEALSVDSLDLCDPIHDMGAEGGGA